MDIARQATEALQSALKENLLAAALFGSRARGEGKTGSDWDLFLLAEELPENPLDRQSCLKATLPLQLATRVSLLARTRQEFESDLLSVYLDIATDGIILYDPEDYLKAKLQEVRRIAENAGLLRRRRKGHWIWCWKKPPEGMWEVNWR